MNIHAPTITAKWKVELSFDRAVSTIDAHHGKNEGCTTSEKKCTFENEGYNKNAKYAGDTLKLEYTLKYDKDSNEPKVTKVVFKYCTAEDCNDWEGSVTGPGGNSSSTEDPNGGATEEPTTTADTITPVSGNHTGKIIIFHSSYLNA